MRGLRAGITRKRRAEECSPSIYPMGGRVMPEHRQPCRGKQVPSPPASSCLLGNNEQRGRGMGKFELIVAILIRPNVGGMWSRNVAVAIKLPSAIAHCRGWRIQVGSLKQKQFSRSHFCFQVHTHAAGGGGVLINNHHVHRASRAASGGIGADVSGGLCFSRQQMPAGSAVSEQVHGVVERLSKVFVLVASPTVSVNRIVRAATGAVADVEVDAAETILGAREEPIESPERGSKGVAHAGHAAAGGGVGFGQRNGQLAFVGGLDPGLGFIVKARHQARSQQLCNRNLAAVARRGGVLMYSYQFEVGGADSVHKSA